MQRMTGFRPFMPLVTSGPDPTLMPAAAKVRIEPRVADAARCRNGRNAQDADFTKFQEIQLMHRSNKRA
jgi:hypothetical protein